MPAKTYDYDRQSAKFIALVAKKMPKMSEDIREGWMNNPEALQKFLEGLCPPPHIIDCDRTPFIPPRLEIKSHKKGGQVLWVPANFKLWLYPKQESGRIVGGLEWLEWMMDRPVFNACMLDEWIAHPEMIPAECKGKVTYFPNTVYRDRDSYCDLCVRCLDYWRGEPFSNFFWFDYEWCAHDPAAGSAS